MQLTIACSRQAVGDSNRNRMGWVVQNTESVIQIWAIQFRFRLQFIPNTAERTFFGKLGPSRPGLLRRPPPRRHSPPASSRRRPRHPRDTEEHDGRWPWRSSSASPRRTASRCVCLFLHLLLSLSPLFYSLRLSASTRLGASVPPSS
jgi:hypothetical protein